MAWPTLLTTPVRQCFGFFAAVAHGVPWARREGRLRALPHRARPLSTPTPSHAPFPPCPFFKSDDKGRFDEVVDAGGVRVLIDPGALMHVVGTTMDWVEDDIT